MNWEQETGILLASGDVRFIRVWDTQREMRMQVGKEWRGVFGVVLGFSLLLFILGCACTGSVLCCAVLCCAVLYCVMLCCAVLCCAVLCCVVLCCAVLCCAVLCCAVLCCVLLCSAMPSVLSCDLMCCVVLCCAVLCFHGVHYCLVHCPLIWGFVFVHLMFRSWGHCLPFSYLSCLITFTSLLYNVTSRCVMFHFFLRTFPRVQTVV